MDVLTTPEAVTVLCLLMIGADEDNKPEEIESMLNNPFFIKHIAEKIGPHRDFLKKYNQAIGTLGEERLERVAVSVLKSAYPAFRTKTLALMTLIAGADNEYDHREKLLMARVATALGIPMEEIGPELGKMKNAILMQASSTMDETRKDDSTQSE